MYNPKIIPGISVNTYCVVWCLQASMKVIRSSDETTDTQNPQQHLQKNPTVFFPVPGSQEAEPPIKTTKSGLVRGVSVRSGCGLHWSCSSALLLCSSPFPGRGGAGLGMVVHLLTVTFGGGILSE